MKSNRSMDLPASVKRQIVSPLKPRPNILPRTEEEKREAAKRPEIRGKELNEAHNALMRLDLRIRDFLYRQIVSPYEPQPNISRPKSNPEKMRAASPASSCGSMRSDGRSIPEKIRAGSAASSCESMKSNRSMTLPVSVNRPASCESVKSDQSMGPPIAFKRVDLGSREPRPHLLPRQIVSPYEPQPNIIRTEEEKREAAKRPEIRGKELNEAHNALMRVDLGSREPRPHLLPRQIVSPYEPQPNIISSLNIPFTMGGAEEDERAEEGTEDSLLKRWIMELQQKTGSPAPSCLSLKTDRSRTPPLNFRDEPGPSDTKDPGIDAGLWTQLNSMVSHLQEHISDCQNEMNTLKKFVRAINPEGQGEYEEGVKCEIESAEKRQQRGIAEDHTGLPEKNESRGTGRLTTGQSSCCSGANVNPVTV